MKRNIYYNIFLPITLILLFLGDRITKFLVINKLPRQGVFLFKNIGLKFETNEGIAFSIPLPPALIIILISLILISLFYFFLKNIKKEKRLNCFLIGLIIIGAISNLIDRINYLAVIDFIKISSWPTFNLSDAYIVTAVIIYVIINLKKTKLTK